VSDGVGSEGSVVLVSLSKLIWREERRRERREEREEERGKEMSLDASNGRRGEERYKEGKANHL